MAINTPAGLTLDGAVGAVATGGSGRTTLLPGASISTDTLVRVVNIGAYPAAVLLSTSSTSTVTASTGVVVMGGQELILARGSSTYIDAVCIGGGTCASQLNIATGN